MNLRPELFRAAILHVPFVDVINTMLDETLPLTVGEFEEWGNPKKKDEYLYMKSYSPYDNLKKGAYPSILVKTSFNDSQVMYWEPAKYVAKLRTLKTDTNPLLLKTNMAGGHGGSSGRYDRLKETAFDQSFVLSELGVPDLPASIPVPARPVHTYSIVARDPATGQLGVAVQSHWFSVGALVPWAEAGRRRRRDAVVRRRELRAARPRAPEGGAERPRRAQGPPRGRRGARGAPGRDDRRRRARRGPHRARAASPRRGTTSGRTTPSRRT